MNKLSPPIIANKLPAFNTKELDIAFNITRAVAPSDFTGVKVLIKTVQNNQIYNYATQLMSEFNDNSLRFPI